MSNNITAKECKFVWHLPAAKGVRGDIHIVKEILHMEDGTLVPNLKIIRNFKKPFWITKPNYRNHKDKKEAEELDKVNKYYSTESDIYKETGIRLDKGFIGGDLYRAIRANQFTYGLDIAAKTYIKHMYMEKYKNVVSTYKVGVLDIEVDTETNTLIVISLAMNDKIFTIINAELLFKKVANRTSDMKKLNTEFTKKLNYLYNKYIPEKTIASNVSREYLIVKDKVECVLKVFEKLHEWKPDIATGWNIMYDIKKILEILDEAGIDPKDVFSDPSLPEEYRYFKLKLGQTSKVTDSGKFKPISVEEQWHSIIAPAHFCWIDNMSAHRYVRVGGKTVSGGYGLNNILTEELGSDLGKLSFKDGTAEHLKGLEWHVYMVNEKPLEYIIYNQWDVLSILELDKKTKDLSVVLPMLSGVSSFEIFNSGPKRIIDAMHFFYLERGRVLATKPPSVEDASLLGLGDWM